MGFRMVEEGLAPLSVSGVEWLADTQAPDWSNWASYGMAAVGYGAGLMGVRGTLGSFLSQVGVASLPGAIRHLRAQMGMTRQVSSSRLAFRPAARPSGGIGVPASASGADSGIIVSTT